MRNKHFYLFLIVPFVILVAAGYRLRHHLRQFVLTGRWTIRTVPSVLEEYGPMARRKFEPALKAMDLEFPPRRIFLLAFKAEKQLEVWAADNAGPYQRVAVYPILGASGGPGPKRRPGDKQVPEGIYRLTDLNPNSQFHLSIRIDYPNEDDIANATVPVKKLGGDIFIHGGSGSIGCLAIGDTAIEDLFCLIALANPPDRHILIAPVDLRANRSPTNGTTEERVRQLYSRLKNKLVEFPRSPGSLEKI